jgi:hypothetical protein
MKGITMKNKAPSIQEIQDVTHQFNNCSFQELCDCDFFQDKRKMIISKRMTQILMCNTTDSSREKIWKYCKKLTTYTHAPVTLNEYHRMLPFSNDPDIVDTIVRSLQADNDKCLSGEFLPDTIGYFYAIATISQSNYRREDIIELLNNIYNYLNQYRNNYLPVLQRNLNVLKTEWPDLNTIL